MLIPIERPLAGAATLAERRNALAHGDPFDGFPTSGLLGLVRDLINYANLDTRQLARIEAVHRGFLYQHLYAAACLFKAVASGVTHVVVENDEDVELVLPGHRIYAQIKTHESRLIFSDVVHRDVHPNRPLARHRAARACCWRSCDAVLVKAGTGERSSRRASADA
ncbi:MAG: hypothetical protein ABF976_15380 [Acetobacter syzygii]|uniref:hypothetical protein n=1 Tax=Acetobacter syzygii TaxID=146476 RepID=UPI0039ECC5B6